MQKANVTKTLGKEKLSMEERIEKLESKVFESVNKTHKDQEGKPKSTTGRSPGVAAALSFLVPGLGQLYNGQVLKGIVLFIITVLLTMTFVGIVIVFFIWIYAILDASEGAKED